MTTYKYRVKFGAVSSGGVWRKLRSLADVAELLASQPTSDSENTCRIRSRPGVWPQVKLTATIHQALRHINLLAETGVMPDVN